MADRRERGIGSKDENITKKPSKDELSKLRRKALETGTEYEKAIAPSTKEIVNLDTQGAPIILFLSDVHYGTSATNMKLLEEVLQFVENHPDARVVILGDEIDGQNSKHTTTTEKQRILDVPEQIEGFQEDVLDRIGEKVIGAVGYFWGHTGWVHDLSGADPWKMVYGKYDDQADALLEAGIEPSVANARRIPIVANMSDLVLNYGDEEIDLRVAHYFSGKSQIDALHSLREAWKKKKKEKKPDVVAAGHHHQTAVAIEHYPGAPVPAVLFSCGTFKGVGEDVPRDAFGTKAGLDSEPGGPGQMMIISKSNNLYRAVNLAQGDRIHAAIDFWDYEHSTAQEAMAIAYDQQPPGITFREKKSEPSIDSEEVLTEVEQEARIQKAIEKEEESGGVIYSNQKLAPLYDQVHYDVVSPWPSLLIPIANVRMGGSYEGTGLLQEMMNEFVINNPHVMVAFLGNVVDAEVAKKENRVEVLDQLAEIINSIGSERTLALLLDSSLRNANWRKDITGLDYVPPGTYVSEKTKVPLLAGGSSIELTHGPNARGKRSEHSIMLLDGLKRHGSYSKALMGLASYEVNHNHAGHDVLISGHHPHSAVGTYQKDGRLVDAIDVGWLSPFDNTSGKKNVQRTAKGGQGLIIDRDLRIPTGDWQETMELFNAMLALTAAQRFNMI